MVMSYIWTGMIALSLICSLFTGTLPQMTAALFHGAESAVTLTLSLAGVLCLWSGIIAVMKETGLSERLAALLGPVLRFLFPQAAADPEAAQCLSGNLTANLLGLGNAATPLGLKAVQRMKVLSGSNEASNEMCRLIVMNTASVQLIPTTVAAVRSALGANAPFDILPAVLVSSLCSVCVGLLASRLLEGRVHD
ncbi:MAG: nucleoside recognition domain-containing protein [Oscillospiraceae bacterium]|nr:nucleoside recognition domain-containing protein [Oscillospiraceae bacterium]